MKHSAPPTARTHTALYEQVVHDALAHSDHLLERVIDSTRQAMQAREDQARTPGERHTLMDARQHLARLTFVMCERFPAALRQALAQGTATEQKATRSLFSVHFDELELMDESQISESIERARAGQVLSEAVTTPLAELNALMTAAQGHPTVSAEHNPLQPNLFLQALQTVLAQMQLTEQVRRDWMEHLAHAMGNELRALYLGAIDQLQQRGVKPAGYAIRQQDGEYVYVKPTGDTGHTPGFGSEAEPWRTGSVEAGAHPVGPQAPAAAHKETLLTLHQLRRLLAGELATDPTPEIPFAERFSLEFENTPSNTSAPAPDFDITIPAAFEALQEMKQVDHMVQRLENRGPQNPGKLPADLLKQDATTARSGVASLGQALGMEVVALMVDNIARDSRLLWPVQRLVKELEPALLKLALADPRFFSDKEHPARRLLQEMTDRSLAFDTLEAPGFESFMQPLIDVAGPLRNANIEGQEPFAHALEQLLAAWAEREQKREQERLRAIETLRRAEQRNLLAARMAREIRLLPQIDAIPTEVARFLQGPWTQVMAQARLNDHSGSNDPSHYRELVDALLWSAQPELTRINSAKLTRLIPKLLSKLRQGLATIDYPPTQTAAFFDLLMNLHQQAFREAPPAAKPASQPLPARQHKDGPALQADETWIAPSEATESGYMVDIPEMNQPPFIATANDQPAPTAEPPSAVPIISMEVGAWVNLQVAGKWERTQLSWIGPHGTLFLFTSAYGHTQSMTKRLLDKLVAQGSMQVISQQTVVAGALDAVARAAMRNSIDTKQ